MKQNPDHLNRSLPALSRRKFIQHASTGTAALGLLGLHSLRAAPTPGSRLVWVASDAHSGRVEDGLDGAEWFARAARDIRQFDAAYGLFLGDMSQGGNEAGLRNYLDARDQSGIKNWYEIAGNHEYRSGRASLYEKLVRSTDPYKVVDGNLVWFFLSDERKGVPGDISEETCDWLEAELAANEDKTLIVCSHQLVSGTLYKSSHHMRRLNPQERIAEIIEKSSIDLWMCGHEHHSPYSSKRIARIGNTSYINVASVSHAYNTKASQSFLLELKPGAKEIVARRRMHDTAEFLPEFEVKIPLRHPIQLG